MSGNSLIDTHCHLDVPPLGDDVPAVLGRAAAAGVSRLVVPAYDLASWGHVLRLAEAHPGNPGNPAQPAVPAPQAKPAHPAHPAHPSVHPALGLHPWVAHNVERENTRTCACFDLKAHLGEWIAKSAIPVVAIGEIGLDTKVDVAEGYPDLMVQITVLEAQLELAVDLDLPVILHCRGAFEELLTAVDRHAGRLRGVLHAFSRGPELADRFLAAGLFIALGGAITRARAERVRRAAVALPLDKILLETDAPSIGLEGILPQDTEPRHVRDVAEAVAFLRGESLTTVAEVTTANACRLFHLEP